MSDDIKILQSGDDTDITEILRDMAVGKKNKLGDHWSPDWCNNAANTIDRLREDNEKMRIRLQKQKDKIELEMQIRATF